MALKHDAQGFLTGDPIDIGRVVKVWNRIGEDVRAIRRAMTSGTPNTPRLDRGSKGASEAAILAVPRKIAIPKTGGAGAGTIRHGAQAAEIAEQAVATVRAARKSVQNAVAKPVSRDGRGRFMRNDARNTGKSGDSSNNSSESDYFEAGALRGVADRIVGAIKDSGNGMEEADPAVKAMNQVARPMARGYELLTGGSSEKKQERWLRRIWTSLTGFRKDETIFNKAAKKSLKNIEEKPDEGKGGDSLLAKVLWQLVSQIPFLGTALMALPRLLKGAGGLLKGIGKGWLGGAMTLGKGALRRLPMIGALISAFSAWSESSDADGDTSLTGDQRRGKKGAAWGGAAGSVIGMAIGSALGGPLGTIVGGFVGDWLGRHVGQIIGENFEAISNAVSGVWDEIKVVALGTFDWIKSGWGTVVSGVKQAWKDTTATFKEVGKSLSEAWNSAIEPIRNGLNAVASVITGAYEFLKNIPVIGSAIRAAEAAAKKAADSASELKNKAVEKVKDGAGKAWEATKTVAAKVVPQGLKDSISKRRNRQTLENQMAAAGITDPNEQAMFMAQMEHESGGFAKMEEGFNYRSADSIMVVSGRARKRGKAAIELAMAQGPEAVAELMYGERMGNTEKGDAYKFRGRGYIQLTGKDNYASAGKALGLDLLNNPELAADPEIAARIATWYWKKKPGLAAAGKAGNVEAATQAINGGQNGIEHRKVLFAKYQAGGVPTTTIAKATVPAEQPSPTLTMAASPPMATPGYVGPRKQAVVAAASTPSVPIMPSPPPVSEAPPVAVPMASNDSNKPIQVSMPPQEVGQDVRDRGIAHVATGGLSA